ncbi:outer membrane protein assembly factor BamE [Parahaliea sp. F7430]|uniref:Outer membrane protein assembly factor BamE n=1 Tax=Sediminihaliea albiluteola TaxID=2758564 RepID=A0A7W2TXD3_9GAMM|nr:outer membrane protein assembly factor BamE [Sediminihaliea albiluteola]MBA6413683.1 outer membrane protein assembly factor BamE [Sediminihaliea albiluteola]
MIRSFLIAALTVFLGACAQYENQRGVEVTWDPSVLKNMTPGKTTRSEVLKQLGPPSQLIALNDETVLYYLYERSKGNGLLLIVYNRFQVDTRYDRAVFIFDENDRLSEFSSKVHETL